MAADLINLRRERKRRDRDTAAAVAAVHRAAFGRTKAERVLSAAELALADRRVAAHRLTSVPAAADAPSRAPILDA